LTERPRRPTILTSSKKGGSMQAKTQIKVRTGLKGGRLAANHNRGLKVTTHLKGGRLATNHNRALLGG
jgi:hypothetical protein